MKGKFIVLEGIDGSGKTTHSRTIANYLFEKDKMSHVLLTREPSNSAYGLEVRKLLKEGLNPKANKEKFTRLFVLDRIEHLKKIVIPAIQSSIHVVCDRYILSTLAYQQTQGMPLPELIDYHTGLRSPDVTFYFNLPVKKALRRSDKKEVFEQEEFLEALRDNYNILIQSFRYEHNIITINTSKPIEEVQKELRKHLDELLQ